MVALPNFISNRLIHHWCDADWCHRMNFTRLYLIYCDLVKLILRLKNKQGKKMIIFYLRNTVD